MKNSPQEEKKKWLGILRHTDEAYVNEADPARPAPRKSRAVAWGIAAACVCCLLGFCFCHSRNPCRRTSRPIQTARIIP